MPRGLSGKERALLLAIGKSMIPGGNLLPPFDEAAVNRFEIILDEVPGAMASMARALIWTIGQGSRTRYLKAFDQLSPRQGYTHLSNWQDGLLPRRTALKLLAILIKSAYFGQPDRYADLGFPYKKETILDEKPHYLAQVTDGRTLTEPLELEAEAVVVGTGAGGAVVAAELAEAGNAVIMVEHGDYRRRHEFTGVPQAMQRMMYRDAGLFFTIGNVPILLPTGICVGGTTAVNSGTCFRAPYKTMRRWREKFGLRELTPAHMEPYFQRVESVYQVTPAQMKYVGKNGEIIARGAERLGYRHGVLSRNAPDCDGQGVCPYGCPTDAKRATNISYVPRALNAGAMLATGVQITSILMENGRAVGVQGIARESGMRVKIRAQAVVLASGTLDTPLLLMTNNLAAASGQLGRNISIHPSAGVAALVDEPVEAFASIPQGYMVDEFADEGLMLEGVALPLEVTALLFPQLGKEYMSIMEQAHHVAQFGFMVEDSSRGRVRPGPDGKPLMTYWLNKHDQHLMLRGVELLNRIYLAAGAKAVYSPLRQWQPTHSQADLAWNLKQTVHAWDIDISAYHPLGSCHMGDSPRRSVTDPYGEVWGTRNLFVADGSAIPPGLGVNPMITISANATRIADYISARLNP
jgi:choline dehydrogenase-like flavoprotein